MRQAAVTPQWYDGEDGNGGKRQAKAIPRAVGATASTQSLIGRNYHRHEYPRQHPQKLTADIGQQLSDIWEVMGLARPAWNAIDTQWCSSFQMITGDVIINAITAPSQGAG